MKLRASPFLRAVDGRLEAGRADDPKARAELAKAVRAAAKEARRAGGAGAKELAAWIAKASDEELARLGETALNRVVEQVPVDKRVPGAFGSALKRVLGLGGEDTHNPAVQLAGRHLHTLLTQRVRYGVSAEPPPASTNRTTWIAERLATGGRDLAQCPHAVRLVHAAGLDAEAVAAFVHDGVRHADAALGAGAVEHMTPEQRAVYFARHRDVNNMLWTEACLAAADALRAADPKTAPRKGAPGELKAYGDLTAISMVMSGDNRATGVELQARTSDGRLDRATHCIDVRGEGRDGIFADGNFYLRIPVGELGEPLARALAEAARIAMAAVAPVATQAATIDPKVHAWASAMQTPDKVLYEGVASIATALATLLAKRPAPPHDTPRAALRAVVESKLVTKFAATAPFGVTGPIGAIGIFPSDACAATTRASGATLSMPPSLVEVLDAVKQHKEKMLLGEHFPSGWATGDHHTETMRGCPVAGRGPVMNADGSVGLSKDSGLSALTNAFAELVEKLLDDEAMRATR